MDSLQKELSFKLHDLALLRSSQSTEKRLEKIRTPLIVEQHTKLHLQKKKNHKKRDVFSILW
jgi:hypothetical protein